MELTKEELDLCRQWFDSVQDVNPVYLAPADFSLARKLYEGLGMRVPHSILDGEKPNKKEVDPLIDRDHHGRSLLRQHQKGLPDAIR